MSPRHWAKPERGAKTEACSPPTVWSAAVPLGRGTVCAPSQARMLRAVQPCQITGYAGGPVWNSSHLQDSLDGKAGVTQTPTRGQQWEGSMCIFEDRQKWKNSTILLKVVWLISFIFRCFIIEYIIYIYIYFFFFKEENRDRQKPKQNLRITLQHYLQQPRYGSNSKHPLTDEWIKIWSIYTIEYYSAIKKEWNNAICSNKDATRDNHTEWSKSHRERQISYDITYIQNLIFF